jgi:hypothetical protein
LYAIYLIVLIIFAQTFDVNFNNINEILINTLQGDIFFTVSVSKLFNVNVFLFQKFSYKIPELCDKALPKLTSFNEVLNYILKAFCNIM